MTETTPDLDVRQDPRHAVIVKALSQPMGIDHGRRVSHIEGRGTVEGIGPTPLWLNSIEGTADFIVKALRAEGAVGLSRALRNEIHEQMAEALTNNVADRYQEVDDSGMTEFISVEDAISITAAVLHSLTSDSADPAPQRRQRIAVLGATYEDASHEAQYLPREAEVTLLSAHARGPHALGHGQVVDALFITPSALVLEAARIERLLPLLTPMFATRKRTEVPA